MKNIMVLKNSIVLVAIIVMMSLTSFSQSVQEKSDDSEVTCSVIIPLSLTVIPKNFPVTGGYYVGLGDTKDFNAPLEMNFQIEGQPETRIRIELSQAQTKGSGLTWDNDWYCTSEWPGPRNLITGYECVRETNIGGYFYVFCYVNSVTVSETAQLGLNTISFTVKASYDY